MASKPYMPLMMGDWIRGTRGMRAEVKGVYIGLLIHQYDHGFLPSDIETLSLIEPEIGKVWVSIKDKFEEFEPGKLRNKKLEEVRDFWAKQSKNGKKGGRPKKQEPKQNPNDNPKTNHQYDLDSDIDIRLEESLDEIYLSNIKNSWKHIDFSQELESFKQKVRGSPDHYKDHDTGGLRLAFQKQLRESRNYVRGSNKKSATSITSFSGDYSGGL